MNHKERQREIWAVVLISIAAVLSAWCAYQAARWGSQQAASYARANATRVESLRQSNLANRQITIDVSLFVAYANAVTTKDRVLSDFLLARFPPRLKGPVTAWLAMRPLKNPAAPSSPFVMKEYHLAATDQAEALERTAKQYFDEGYTANETADRYILMTVLFASVSFLAGVGSKFEQPQITVVALALGTIVLLVAGAVLTAYPVH
jgi:hypothetical protein